MNNREWLYSPDVADLADWFDAEHVDANDVSTRKGDVRADDVCANDGFMDLDSCTHGVRTFASETDSREKLEADVRKFVYGNGWFDDGIEPDSKPYIMKLFIGWLNRQAAITKCEAQKRHELFCEMCERENDEQLAELKAKLKNEKKHREYAYKEANKFIEVNGKLVKNVNALTTRVDELTAEREQYRELFSQAITQAAEIVNLQP